MGKTDMRFRDRLVPKVIPGPLGVEAHIDTPSARSGSSRGGKEHTRTSGTSWSQKSFGPRCILWGTRASGTGWSQKSFRTLCVLQGGKGARPYVRDRLVPKVDFWDQPVQEVRVCAFPPLENAERTQRLL